MSDGQRQASLMKEGKREAYLSVISLPGSIIAAYIIGNINATAAD
jgi:hypothetical protein